MLAVVLGLAAGLSWGISDFLGGLKSRTLQLLAVVALSQGAALVLVAVLVLLRGEAPPPGEQLAYGAIAGVSGLVGLLAFYRGLAIGVMAVVAPIAGTGAIVPVAAGLLSGERPSVLQGLGIAAAIAGVVMASRERPEEGRRVRVAAGVGLALVAAAGFGFFFVALDAGSEDDLFWALLASRAASVSCIAVAVAALRPSLRVGGRNAAPLLLIGTLDVAANGLFAAAASEGLISVAAVLASLYPVVTVLLARSVLGERVEGTQRAGVVVALAGVVLISAG